MEEGLLEEGCNGLSVISPVLAPVLREGGRGTANGKSLRLKVLGADEVGEETRGGGEVVKAVSTPNGSGGSCDKGEGSARFMFVLSPSPGALSGTLSGMGGIAGTSVISETIRVKLGLPLDESTRLPLTDPVIEAPPGIAPGPPLGTYSSTVKRLNRIPLISPNLFSSLLSCEAVCSSTWTIRATSHSLVRVCSAISGVMLGSRNW